MTKLVTSTLPRYRLDDDFDEDIDEDDDLEDDDADDDDDDDEEDEDVETWQVSEMTRAAKGQPLLDFGPRTA